MTDNWKAEFRVRMRVRHMLSDCMLETMSDTRNRPPLKRKNRKAPPGLQFEPADIDRMHSLSDHLDEVDSQIRVLYVEGYKTQTEIRERSQFTPIQSTYFEMHADEIIQWLGVYDHLDKLREEESCRRDERAARRLASEVLHGLVKEAEQAHELARTAHREARSLRFDYETSTLFSSSRKETLT